MPSDATRHAGDARGEAAPADPLLSLSQVTLVYERAGGAPVRALDDISLELRRGERVCVLGANGSGKSTLASVLCGLLAPDAGSVRLLGEEACVDGRVDLDAYRRARRGIGLVFQNPDDQIVTSVVADDVAFGPENLGVPADEIGQRVLREIHRVALDDYADADPRRLSGGQQQRVAVAGALAMEPQVVVFDEPGALLDVRGRSALLRVMGRLRDAGVGVVHITHYMEEALGADRVVVLDGGHVVLAGTPEEVFSQGHDLAALGLEQPFAGRLATRLAAAGVPLRWTCDEDELLRELVARAGGAVGGPGATSAQASLHFYPSEGCPNLGSGGYAAAKAQVAGDDTPAVRQKSTLHRGKNAADVLTASRVSFSYGGPQGRKALDDVGLTVRQGQSVAIVGQTGSGKSTLLRLLCALDLPDSGEVLLGGMPTRTTLRGRKARAWRARLRSKVGYVMQRPERQLFANTVEEDVAFGPRNLGLSGEELRERVEHTLRLVGLSDRRDASPFELSGGKQRLCAIAGVLAMQPDTLVFDEPTAGLDPHARRELRTLIADLLAHGVTIVQVTHSMEDAARADEVIVLDRSRVQAAGTPQEVFSRERGLELSACGLGLPRPLAWALRLEQAGVAGGGALGNPLTTDELVAALLPFLAPRDGTPQDGTPRDGTPRDGARRGGTPQATREVHDGAQA